MVSSETSTVSTMTVLTDCREAGAPKVSHAPTHQQMMAKKGGLSLRSGGTETASTQPLSAVKYPSAPGWQCQQGWSCTGEDGRQSASVRGMCVGQACG